MIVNDQNHYNKHLFLVSQLSDWLLPIADEAAFVPHTIKINANALKFIFIVSRSND